MVKEAGQDEHGLNPRQRRFVELFTGGMAAGRAYVAAGYEAKGADQAASLLLRNIKVLAAIKATQQKAAEKAEMERGDLVSYLVEVIRTPIGQISENHRLCESWQMDPATGALRVRMPSKLAAAKQLADIMGWNRPQEVKLDLSEKLADIIQRVRES
ncbi:MAG: terminase small subunit [Verrucomicrobiota bacterium]